MTTIQTPQDANEATIGAVASTAGLEAAVREELGEPEYKLQGWSRDTVFEYWTWDAISAAISRAESRQASNAN